VQIANSFLRLAVRWATVSLSLSALLLLAAGTTRVPSLRHYLLISSTLLLTAMFVLDPGLVEERSRTPDMAAARTRFSASLCSLATLGLASLDVGRLHRLASVPPRLRLASLLLFGITTTLQIWAMSVNPFFSPEIRLQAERGHRVITSGPYRLVRHPGYLAMLVSVPASALAIGSWLALAPAAAFCVVILKRVRVEDEFLRQNLSGYADYMGRVPGRLVPSRTIGRRQGGLSFVCRFGLHRHDRRRP
jgi:protein-S-isoprenylcysteine O-methyltransferase Ste14